MIWSIESILGTDSTNERVKMLMHMFFQLRLNYSHTRSIIRVFRYRRVKTISHISKFFAMMKKKGSTLSIFSSECKLFCVMNKTGCVISPNGPKTKKKKLLKITRQSTRKFIRGC